MKSNQLNAINQPGMYRVALGLYLRVAPGGSKQFVQRIMIQGKRCDIGLGGWPATSLTEAKEKAICNRAEVLAGGNPITGRSTLKQTKKRDNLLPSFAQIQEETLDNLKVTWRNPKTGKNWKEGMDKYVTSVIGNTPIDEVSREDVLNILVPLWIDKPNLARKTRQRMSAVFKLAMAYGYIDSNLAGEAIDGALPKQNPKKSHHRALPYSRVPRMLEAVWKADVNMAAMAAICWLTLTACRSSEARNAKWTEINLKNRIWKIPSSRMKANKEHRVPITEGMILILEIVKPLKDGSGYLFPSTRCPRNPLGENSFSHLIRYVGYGKQTTIHGLRSSFRDWAAEKGVSRELAEQALAHSVQGVEASYFRSDLLRKRRAVMKQWDEHCMKKCRKILENLIEQINQESE
ncbi:MAG: tyrosine-type recombinase/integrase [Gammaproteobacteria bacterium]|nr:tyrosine-type recombinase/integrase [Gammaproteobacteria bacterium]MCY4218689.1 tyrosine-type recombinase/integrase [Gammaproteobacteria bacterium]MCY4273827.1 tyrosine-type recombinase/integrase [Gammaproteobacteria bacterium]